MCGVVGVLGFALPKEEKRSRVSVMLGALAHRGPDAWGTYADSLVALGHVRLSIVDIGQGHQPFVLGEHALSYNGEVYNHIELRAELESLGERFRTTNSDTEVLLCALRRWGPDALRRLNGQFAFLWWDGARRRLMAARDRYGVRPLYWTEHRGSIWFASELKAFDTVSGFERRIEPAHLVEHGLFWNTLQDRTIYGGIHSIEAGTFVSFEPDAAPRIHRYHQLGDGPTGALPNDFEEAKDMLRARLAAAVQIRLRSDVPVGNYLSGGIDSSVVTLLTDRLRTDSYRTFSVAFDEPSLDESSFQSLMSRRLNAKNHTLRIECSDIERGFEQAVYHGERPIFRTAPVPLMLLANVVRDTDTRVVLTGEAADETLWGYDTFKELKLLRFWAKHPSSRLRPQLIRHLYPHLAHYRDSKQYGLMRMFYEGFLDRYDNALAGLNLRVHNNRILVNYMLSELGVVVTDDWLFERIESMLPPAYGRWSLLQRNQFLEMRTLLQGYLLSSQGDRMSLAYGIEGRYPFLDHNLVEWLFRLPDQYKLPMMSHKHLLREAFRDELPREIVDRPKHPYQAPDLKAFFREGRLCELAQEHLGLASLKRVGLFEPRMVQRFLNKFARGIPEQVGYRDNMVLCFLLSTQLAAAHARAPFNHSVPSSRRTVDIVGES